MHEPRGTVLTYDVCLRVGGEQGKEVVIAQDLDKYMSKRLKDAVQTSCKMFEAASTEVYIQEKRKES